MADSDSKISDRCNTSNGVRSRNWIWTLNNYSEEDKKFIEGYIETNCVEGIFQPEVGKEGTPHLQGFFCFQNQRRFTELKKVFPKMHLEVAKNKEACKAYCKKEDTRAGETFIKEVQKSKRRPLEDPLEGIEPYWWQKEIIEMMENKPDKRTIHWYWEENGNIGKTTLAKHLCIKHPDKILMLGGKADNIKYGIQKFLENEDNDLYMAIIDLVRSNEMFVSYEGLEAIKNGIFFSGKYDSGMVTYNCPHVVVFANFPPDTEKLSKDRWRVVNIGEQ